MIVDKDDVPEMVQEMRYHYSDMTFDVLFFNGMRKMFASEYLCPSIGIMDRSPTRTQALEALNNIHKLAEKHWREWVEG